MVALALLPGMLLAVRFESSELALLLLGPSPKLDEELDGCSDGSCELGFSCLVFCGCCLLELVPAVAFITGFGY